MRSSEIRLRKLKLRLRDKRFANHKVPCTAIRQQPLQSVLALRSCSATDLFYIYREYPAEEFSRCSATYLNGYPEGEREGIKPGPGI